MDTGKSNIKINELTNKLNVIPNKFVVPHSNSTKSTILKIDSGASGHYITKNDEQLLTKIRKKKVHTSHYQTTKLFNRSNMDHYPYLNYLQQKQTHMYLKN